MKGIALARYLMIVSLSAGSAGAWAAMPQQVAEDATGNDSSSVSRNAPPSDVLNPSHSNSYSEGKDTSATGLEDIGARLWRDQKQIWTSPFRLRLEDSQWLVPVAGITTGFVLTDPNFSKALSNNRNTINTYKDIRLGGVTALGAASAGFYLWSLHTHDPRQRETGLLAGEAIVDTLVVTEGLNLIAGRERPLQGNGQGNFFQGGDSFPSNHSAAAWAAAGIIAHEYHGPLTKIFAYGVASAVSFASVGSKQHFPSDVLIGSGLGLLVSEYVYRSHHNPELGGAAWTPFREIFQDKESGPSKYPGSTYVPGDSWVYLAFDRLTAFGYLSHGFQGMKPWSREQCARLLVDVDAAIGSPSGLNAPLRAQALMLAEALHREFAREEATFHGPNQSLELDSIYSRVLSASGTVLNDGFHFGQTFSYDYGRPFRQGTNLIVGGSASATYGNLFFYVNGEYQHSPSQPALSDAVREFISDRDKVPLPPDTPFAPINRFQLVEAYGGVNVAGWQFTLGNQSLSWGPGIGGSLLLSNNAAPFPMLRIAPENAIEIPGFSKIFGPFSIDQFFGRLDGFTGASQPWIYGQKISLKPLASLEFAYGRTTLIGGTGHPLTANFFFLSMFGRVDEAQNSVPGDSRTAIDWSWRIPGIHDWATFYGELEDDDDLIPLQNVAKSVVRPGIYLSRLPFLPKWDLHFEWTSSTSPGRASFQNHGSLNYWNLQYPNGYTNDGDLMGNTVGREGVTLQAWIRYWASPRHTFDFSWKQSRVLSDFVPGGGKWQDYQASYSITKRSGVYLNALCQFEHISSYPLLFSGSRNNVVVALELGFLPQWRRQSAIASPLASVRGNSFGGPSL
jgi:Capsule assembly protein Wzi/PAP2 superfamily